MARTLTNRQLKSISGVGPLSPMSATRASYRRGTTSASSGSFMEVQRYEEKAEEGDGRITIYLKKTNRKKNTRIQKTRIVLK